MSCRYIVNSKQDIGNKTTLDIPDKQYIRKERTIYQADTIPETKYEKNKKAKRYPPEAPAKKNPQQIDKQTNTQTNTQTNKYRQN